MSKIIIYSLILLFLYLIIQHFLTTKEGAATFLMRQSSVILLLEHSATPFRTGHDRCPVGAGSEKSSVRPAAAFHIKDAKILVSIQEAMEKILFLVLTMEKFLFYLDCKVKYILINDI